MEGRYWVAYTASQAARASGDRTPGSSGTSHALMCPHASCADERRPERSVAMRPVMHSYVHMRSSLLCGRVWVRPKRNHTPSPLVHAQTHSHVRTGRLEPRRVEPQFPGWNPESAEPGAPGEGGITGSNIQVCGHRPPPAGYGHQRPQFAAPRTWWDGTATTGSQPQFASPHFPRGGSYTRPCRR